ncbi:MAG: hypothetical protein K1060chlam5_00439 [Candidatus Anoxychlamydiales bacterium]|nr:hypothetical protein [Candidatus Anoxychlamydiales bacterium]
MKKLFIIFLFLSIKLFPLDWQEFYSIPGKCLISFPNKPYHRAQILPIYEANAYMQYDVYLSEIDEENSVCMMVVAKYPTAIDPKKEEVSLESFLNGMIGKNKNRKVIEANFCDFKNCNALNFTVEKENRNFQGKVFIFNDKLYLIAIEHNSDIEMEDNLEEYINSFSFEE